MSIKRYLELSSRYFFYLMIKLKQIYDMEVLKWKIKYNNLKN